MLLTDVRRRALRSLIPPPRLRLSEWIEANIKLPGQGRLCFGGATVKPHQASMFDYAVQVDGRDHGRTPAVQLLIDERDALLIEAARFYPGCKDRETARRLRSALLRYRTTG